jgi:hypothetical protein
MVHRGSVRRFAASVRPFAAPGRSPRAPERSPRAPSLSPRAPELSPRAPGLSPGAPSLCHERQAFRREPRARIQRVCSRRMPLGSSRTIVRSSPATSVRPFAAAVRRECQAVRVRGRSPRRPCLSPRQAVRASVRPFAASAPSEDTARLFAQDAARQQPYDRPLVTHDQRPAFHREGQAVRCARPSAGSAKPVAASARAFATSARAFAGSAKPVPRAPGLSPRAPGEDAARLFAQDAARQQPYDRPPRHPRPASGRSRERQAVRRERPSFRHERQACHRERPSFRHERQACRRERPSFRHERQACRRERQVSRRDPRAGYSASVRAGCRLAAAERSSARHPRPAPGLSPRVSGRSRERPFAAKAMPSPRQAVRASVRPFAASAPCEDTARLVVQDAARQQPYDRSLVTRDQRQAFRRGLSPRVSCRSRERQAVRVSVRPFAASALGEDTARLFAQDAARQQSYDRPLVTHDQRPAFRRECQAVRVSVRPFA